MRNDNHANRFQASQAAQIMGRESITVARLGQVIAPERPAYGKGHRAGYSFRNLVEMRLAEELARFGVPQKRTQHYIESLRRSWGKWLEEDGSAGWVVLDDQEWGAGSTVDMALQTLERSRPVGAFLAVDLRKIKESLRANMENIF